MAVQDEALGLNLQAVRLGLGWTGRPREEVEVSGGAAGIKAEATDTGAAETVARLGVTGMPSSQCLVFAPCARRVWLECRQIFDGPQAGQH